MGGGGLKHAVVGWLGGRVAGLFYRNVHCHGTFKWSSGLEHGASESSEPLLGEVSAGNLMGGGQGWEEEG